MKEHNPGTWIAAAVVAAILIVAASIPSKRPPEAPAAPAQPAATDASSPADTSIAQPPPPAPRPVVETVPDSPPPTAATTPPPPPRDTDEPPLPPDPELPPATRDNVVQAIDDLLLSIRDFRTALGGNPTGTNAEITAALLGDNLKQVKIPLPRGSRLNGARELCDLWGTPYFFHQISGTQMEIRSAGPDRRMWTGDDIRQ